jgi:hypothetical protein
VVHLVLNLLGRHVARGAGAGVRQELHGLRAVEPLVVWIFLQPGQAEVEDVHARRALVARFDDHVRRLEVTVDHAAGVCMRQRIQDLIDDRPHDRIAELCLTEVVQRHAGHELHDQVGRAAEQLPEIRGVHDARMIERRERPRLFVEPRQVILRR